MDYACGAIVTSIPNYQIQEIRAHVTYLEGESADLGVSYWPMISLLIDLW